MNTLSAYCNFRNDLLHLYCSTKSAAIEAEFLRFSQDQSNNFIRWLMTSKGVKKKLIDPSVYDAFIKLIQIKNKYPDIKQANLRSIIVNDTELTSVIPVFLALDKVSKDGEFKDILWQFEDVLAEIGSIVSPLVGSFVGSSDIGLDLKTLEENYANYAAKEQTKTVERKIPLYQQRELTFRALLMRFSEELALAAQNDGMEELAGYFRGGVLAKPIPFGLGQYVDFDGVSNDQMMSASKMANHIWKYPDPKYQNYLHDLIEVNLLNASGAISQEDATSIKQRFEREKDISALYMNEDGDGEEQGAYSGMESEGIINIDDRLNPDFIYLLSSLFVMLQRKMKVPTPFMD